jgi:hypothetical protein
MDDIAREVCERQAKAKLEAKAERNEYLVDQLCPLHRVRGKQENVLTIEVYVLWQKVDGREYWHRPYVTTVTFAELRQKPDALWRLLTRCLPFKEWKYLDWSVEDFHPRFYSQNDDDEPLTPAEQDFREYWFEGFMYDRMRPWANEEYPDKVANMKEDLRELVSEDHGIIMLHEQYGTKERRQVGKCWFVLSAVPEGRWT